MQYGFHAGRSTLEALQEVQKKVGNRISMKPKSEVEYLMRISSSYREDRTLFVEGEGSTIEVEIRSQKMPVYVLNNTSRYPRFFTLALLIGRNLIEFLR